MKGANGVNENGAKNKVNKKKKDAIKSTVDSPFNFKWPALDYGLYSNIVSSLNQSFTEYVSKIKNEVDKKEDDTDVPPTKAKNIVKKWVTRAEPRCIVFGYNAVMRGLEKNSIKSVFVKAEATPGYLTKTFIPICNLKNIPVLPIKNLSQIFEQHISTKSSLAVGLTTFACKENAPFSDLYQKCCQAVGLGKKLSCVDAQKATASPLEEMQKSKPKMIDVSAYHLKRENKSYRVFKPSSKRDELDSGFIKIDFADAEKLVSRRESPKFKDKNLMETHFDTSFFIDMGDESVTEEETKFNVDYQKQSKQMSTSRYFNALGNSCEMSGSSKRKRLNYIPTKTKRIRGNPKRH